MSDSTARPGAKRGSPWFATMAFGLDRGSPLDTDLPPDSRPDSTGLQADGPSSPGLPPVAPFVRRNASRAAASGEGTGADAAQAAGEREHEPPERRRREPPAPFLRLFRAFSIARTLLGLLLLGIQVLVVVYLGGRSQWPSLGVCALQVAAALAVLAWPVPPDGYMAASGRLRGRWAMATVAVDLSAFTLLLALSGASVNAVALYMLPVLMAATLMPRRPALGVASTAALLMLVAAWWSTSSPAELATAMMQAGIAGGGVLTAAALAGELADRLARQELAARSTLELARQQARLNRLMIEEMQDGVMVADRRGRIQAANPAALQLIGARMGARFEPFDLDLLPAWQPMRDALVQAFADGAWPESGRELALKLPGPGGDERHAQERPLRLRMRFTRRRARSGEALCVLFLEDVRTLRARERQERLAAMGRVSAGIAHEIRNPLAAIAQANALLAEDLSGDPAQQRLARIVADNVVRLQRIVDDVAEVSPGAPREAPVIDLGAQVAALCADWARTAGIAAARDAVLFVDPGDGALPVRFDVEHLRRVLVNLLDNALRHGSGQPHAVWVRACARPQGLIELSVASDGEVISPEVEPHLFEPFFSTRSRGTGLGLYICRELCGRYRASIEFRPRGPGARHRNVFVVTMPRVALASAAPSTPPSAS
ncbi:ATP-binding protein [Sphaerotilus uruguayifluvii]|uniref:histidine kinase n=1 Tax=Sphaerotilus uruguayifluvii TaxID=2735897 RepID=A0ABX2FX34_9BURK|nr:ATP-binding protein [Leptothrix sp. C29]NRT54588.1 two-component system sensor histidine kinase PilS (NtrC family) [Leptothrix sp. C29]